MTILVSSDWLPRCQDMGYDSLISSLAPMGYADAVLETHLSEPYPFTVSMLAQYLADRQLVGALPGCSLVDGPGKTGVERHVAPAGMGTDGTGVWFSAPSSGILTVHWYRNGELTVARAQDLATDRSATLVELDAVAGDIVQVCVVVADVVGWWARIEV